MLDRRATERRRTLREGRIRFHRDWPLVDCAVKNESAGGACLELPGEFNVTLAFTVEIGRDAKPAACRQVWRQGNRIGVAFC